MHVREMPTHYGFSRLASGPIPIRQRMVFLSWALQAAAQTAQLNLDFTKIAAEPRPWPVACASGWPCINTAEFQIDPARRDECIELMRDARLIYLRNDAV